MVTGVQTCALPISLLPSALRSSRRRRRAIPVVPCSAAPANPVSVRSFCIAVSGGFANMHPNNLLTINAVEACTFTCHHLSPLELQTEPATSPRPPRRFLARGAPALPSLDTDADPLTCSLFAHRLSELDSPRPRRSPLAADPRWRRQRLRSRWKSSRRCSSR